MTKARKISILTLLLLVSILSAENLKIGFFIGVNEFKKESHVWDQYDLYENHLGYYYFDGTGTSIQFGTQIFIGKNLAAIMQYRTPRRQMSYFYSMEHAVVNVIYDPSITVVRSYSSGFSSEFRYFPFGNKQFSPYLGLGGELAILNIGEYLLTDNSYIGDWRLVSEHSFSDMGTKLLGGLIIPIGFLVNMKDHISFDFCLNYTFMRINDWDVTGDVPVEQDMGGLYLKVGVAYNL